MLQSKSTCKDLDGIEFDVSQIIADSQGNEQPPKQEALSDLAVEDFDDDLDDVPTGSKSSSLKCGASSTNSLQDSDSVGRPQSSGSE